MPAQVRTFTLVSFVLVMLCALGLGVFGTPYLERTTGIPAILFLPVFAIALFLGVRTWLAAKARQAADSSSSGDRNG
jgi:hypothetical protein